MHYLIYASRARIPESDAEHEAILATCRRHNPAHELTGFLHREAGFFLQYLEGPGPEIDALMARIIVDPRHDQLVVLARGPLKVRQLPDWSMGFVAGDQLSLAEMLDIGPDQVVLTRQDPLDIITFMVTNAHLLCGQLSGA